MVSLRWASRIALTLATVIGATHPVDAQWQTSAVALRTNGSIMRAGDCLHLDLVTFDQLPGPFTTRVTYRFDEAVTVTDQDGKETQATRPVTRQLPVGPTLDLVAPFQRVQLDDSLCFGEGTLPGAYEVEVSMRYTVGSAAFGTLRTCVVFDDAATPASAKASSCRLLLRGVKRAESSGTIVFEGDFPPSGLYKAALIRNNTIEAVIEGGVYRSGAHELVISSPELQDAAGGDMDLLVVDEASGWSTTLARLVIPHTN